MDADMLNSEFIDFIGEMPAQMRNANFTAIKLIPRLLELPCSDIQEC